jgi:murein DD-endopeptidase MepM/ murein hydrolase activator NlpD
MSDRSPRYGRRILSWIIVIGVIAGVAYVWGDNLLHYVTGQDILDDLRADLAARPERTAEPADAEPTPVVGAAAVGDANAVDQPIAAGEGDDLAQDGFPTETRPAVLKYTVQPGDALFTIADRFDVHPNTIFWANTEVLQDNVHLLQVGMELYILPVNGVYHLSDGEQTVAEIAADYGVTPGDILYSEYNDLADLTADDVLPEGLRVVVPGGRRDYISWRAPIQTGAITGESNPEGTIHPGSCRQFYSGSGGAGLYMNPMGTGPYRVTQVFYPWHPAVDLAADVKDAPIYASETGVVVFAGWHREGYGELVILDHGDGWTTYYAHLATRFVGCGDQVSKGQLIGLMGMTGNATGLHLHFEIRENDVPLDPRDFIDISTAGQ